MNVDEEWANFIATSKTNYESSDSESESIDESQVNEEEDENAVAEEKPICSEMYVSTKSKIVFLNQAVDLKTVFWQIPIIDYAMPRNGVIKKQMKFNSLNREDAERVQKEVTAYEYVEQYVIRSIDNPDGRIKFKDIRKISVGLAKKDLLSHRCKKKSAFYNCFVLILRLFSESSQEFKEHHVKIFNTGKVGVVGVQTMESFYEVLDFIVACMKPYFPEPLSYKKETCETILINSNFNTNFLINREAFYDVLKDEYNMEAIYDPCSYPGIQCKYSYGANNCHLTQLIKEAETLQKKEQIKVSFMIFRTGSILIVGKCDEHVLSIVYNFLKTIIEKHFKQICQVNKGKWIDNSLTIKAPKKIKKKNSFITSSTAFFEDSFSEEEM